MKSIICLFLLSVFILTGCVKEESSPLVIPRPQSMKSSAGSLVLKSPALFVSTLQGKDGEEFADYLKASPLKLKEGDSETAVVQFNLTESVPSDCLRDTLKNVPDSVWGDVTRESYRMSVRPDGVVISASSSAGLFYGFQTLLQLAQQEADGSFLIPVTEIEDTPRFPYRGIHFDVSRHFRTKESLKKQIDAMARYKLNRFHWHLTDGAGWRLEIKRYPELTGQAAYRPYPNWKGWWEGGRKYCTKDAPGADGGYYTQEDVREIVEYARLHHITVIPEIEMPSHSEEVLAVYPQLSCSGKPYVNSEFCIGKEETFTFLQNVLLEVMEMFPSEYIHIGGDEADKTSWKNCPDCQKRIHDEGLADEKELQSYLIHRIERFLNEHHRRLLGWDEILEGGVAPEATVMSWRGEEGGIEAAKAGHDVIMTPRSYCYLDAYQDAPVTQPEAIGGYLTLEKVYSYNPLPEVLTREEAAFIKGVQANVWAEYITTSEQMEYMMYPRVLALAEVAWTQPEHKDWGRFRKAVLKETSWLQANGYHPFDINKEMGERAEATTPVKHLAMMKPVTYAYPYASQYTAGGDSALVDGLRGGWAYSDKRWQGFINTDIDITVDLGVPTEIHLVSAEFMQLRGPYIWLPREVIISVSADGNAFIELKRITTDVPTTESRFTLRNYQWDGDAKARYVRYQALSNDIENGCLFTDEIIIR